MRNVFKKRECTEYVIAGDHGKKESADHTIRFCRKIIKTYRDVQLYWIVLSEMLMENRWMWKSSRIMKVHLAKRARYHSGLMDMNTLNPGQDFDELPESYVMKFYYQR